MTLANQITLIRIALTFAFMIFLMAPSLWSRVAAWVVYLIATSTDWLDGHIARRTRTTSSFGAMADPLADKLLVAGAFIAFVGIKELKVPGWGVFLIVAREFMITGLRSIAAVRGVVLRAERWGKWKMGIQSVCVSLILTLLVLRTAIRKNPSLLQPYIDSDLGARILQETTRYPHYLTLVAVVSAWVSGIWYLYRYRDLLSSSLEANDDRKS